MYSFVFEYIYLYIFVLQVLQITHRDEQDFYDTSIISDHQVLRLMAFCSLLIDLLEKGLSNHSSVRYKQFAKRLGRLVRHTTQYATDHWQVFRLVELFRLFGKMSLLDGTNLDGLCSKCLKAVDIASISKSELVFIFTIRLIM